MSEYIPFDISTCIHVHFAYRKSLSTNSVYIEYNKILGSAFT